MRVLFSCAAESLGWAASELRSTFGPGAKVAQLASDLGAVSGVSLAEVADACEQRRIVFVRHLTRELSSCRAPTPSAIAERVLESVAVDPAPGGIALQTWASDDVTLGFGPLEAFTTTREALLAAGHDVARSARPHVVSCCLSGSAVHLGRSELPHALSDWPGGRVRLARHSERISRSEFKLEELFKSRPLPVGTRALDFGASPGGWTRVLRGFGFEVVAVDPGDLSPRLAGDAKVRHVRATAGAYLEQAKEQLDLVTNDMRMDPVESSRIMLDVARLLRPGASVVLTLKLGNGDPLPVIRKCLEMLSRIYDLRFVRQLHHNRLELTVLGQLR
jgi:23S rRNA (cytidine2498-2'-O)-methyltransferase